MIWREPVAFKHKGADFGGTPQIVMPPVSAFPQQRLADASCGSNLYAYQCPRNFALSIKIDQKLA
jgi:hypothetical protein